MAPRVTTFIRSNGIAVLSFSNPPVNALSKSLRSEISNELKALSSDSKVRAIIIHGANIPGFFSSGADVSEFATMDTSKDLGPDVWISFDGEDVSVPVIAAIDGICFGGALELSMCCTARVATLKSSFSLPELKLGIIPGSGGTQRLPRLVGFALAADMMLTSKPIQSLDALRAGLIDTIAEGEGAVDAAATFALKLLGEGSLPPKTIERSDRLEDLATCQNITNKLKNTVVPKLSKNGQLLQFDAALDVAIFGVKHGGHAGLQEEARVFARLVSSPQSRGLVHTFFATRQTTKYSLQGDPAPSQPGTLARKVGVIGGGLMGAGIATACLTAGIPVVIKELNETYASQARDRVARNLGVQNKDRMTILLTTTDYSELKDVDIVIEAVLENPTLKRQVFGELDAVCKSSCILATNTSTINVDLIGMGASKAHAEGRVIGAHFFSPAHKMPLLEVVRTESTSANTIKNVLALGKKIKKTAVLVGNCAGFAVNRMYFPQSMVAGFLSIQLAIDPYRIDRACEEFGLPMGPFRLLDLVGVDIGAAVGGVFEMAFAERSVATNPVITAMLASGRKGQKTGKGFYRYDVKGRAGKPDEEGLAPFLTDARASVKSEYSSRIRSKFPNLSDDDIINMILLPCVNEGCRILDEGVAQSASDLDICSIMGMAFPPHKGGLMYWAQHKFGGSVGVLSALEAMYHSSEGFPLFKPSFALIRAARADKAIGTVVRPPLNTGSAKDIVIVSAYRTAVGRASRGGFKDTIPDDMIVPVLQTILEKTKIDVNEVGDVIAGTVLQRGDTGVVEVRVSGLLAGLPKTVPVKTVNRLCSSGLQAIADGAASILAGHHKIVIAGGFESMSMASMDNKEVKLNPKVPKHKEAIGCYMSMGETSENVAEKYGISREQQDRMAVTSHARASLSRLASRQRAEIVPIRTKVKQIDKETKRVIGSKEVLVDTDEGVRVGVTLDRLAKLPAVFKRGGSTTPGNSSQLSDGAAFVMLMSREEAVARGLDPLASLRSFAVVGVEPSIMGIGPVKAIPLALERAGITKEDVDLFELNEAFGSQAEYCVEELGLNRDIVNVNGGAIAIGHPLGMTGARLTVSIIHELRRRGGRFGVISMCIGTGMGAAAVYEIHRPSVPAKM